MVASLPSTSAAAIRFFTAGILLLLWAALRGEPWPGRAEWRSAILLGLVMFAGDYGCLFWAEKHIASGLAAVISALIPVEIALFEWRAARRSPSKALLAGTACGVAGVAALSIAHGRGGGVQVGAIAALLFGTLCWSAGTIWSRSLPLPKSKVVSAGVQMMFGGLWLGIIAALLGEPAQLRTAAVTGKTIAAMAYLIIAASIVAFTAYVWLIGHESPTRVASYAYVNPVIAVLLGSAFAGEKLTLQTVLGTALVLVGVIAVMRAKAGTSGPAAARKPA